jgi:hypothetical protein
MKLRVLLFAVVALATLAPGAPLGAAEPSAPLGRESRVRHLEAALVALGETPAPELANQTERARTLARGPCSAGTPRLRVECLLVAMERDCSQRGDSAGRCRLTMDVVASNALADERLIPPADRYRILRDNVDYRAALARELRRIQGGLAVEFRLFAGDVREPHPLAESIDRFCLTSADDTRFPYPTCASSLAWFIRGPQ